MQLKMKQKNKKGKFFNMLMATLGAILLRNVLTGKGLNRWRFKWRNVSSWLELLILLHPLTNFKTEIYYQKEPKFNDVYSRNNLNKIEDPAYIINLDE